MKSEIMVLSNLLYKFKVRIVADYYPNDEFSNPQIIEVKIFSTSSALATRRLRSIMNGMQKISGKKFFYTFEIL